MTKRFLCFYILLVLSLIANAYYISGYYLLNLELKNLQNLVRIQGTNEKVLIFANLFVDKVLLGKAEVGFDDRLKLENAVRDIDDKIILEQWKAFTESKTDGDAQLNSGKLFQMIFNKIYK